MQRGRRKSFAARKREERRYAVRKVRRAVSMQIMVEDSKICNIVGMRRRLKTVS